MERPLDHDRDQDVRNDEPITEKDTMMSRDGEKVIRNILSLPDEEISLEDDLLATSAAIAEKRIAAAQMKAQERIGKARTYIAEKLKKIERSSSAGHFAEQEVVAEQNMRQFLAQTKYAVQEFIAHVRKEQAKRDANIRAHCAETPKQMARALRKE